MNDQGKVKEMPFIYRILTWIAAGTAATWGTLVAISDPQTLDNIVSLPSRLSSYFEEEKLSLFDDAMVQIIVQGHIRQTLEHIDSISANSKDKLASRLANLCLERRASAKQSIAVKALPDVDKTETSPSALDEYLRSKGNVNSEFISATDYIAYIVGDCSYTTGFLLGTFGLHSLIQHVENGGQQRPLKDALGKLGFGGVSISVPPLNDFKPPE